MIGGRRVLLAVTGGVAAFKVATLARMLIEHGAEVRTVMTASSLRFLGANTMAAITGRPVITDLFDSPDSVSPHTEAAEWADLVVVVPATAASLSRLAHGQASDPVSATVLAATCPIAVAPAMHTAMWEHPATRRNVTTLRSDGVAVLGPVSGRLAGGDTGAGRMVEPDQVFSMIQAMFEAPLRGVRVVVTAGGTREAIDPVRFLSNHSSGKMGHAVAAEAARRGAETTLVTCSRLESPPGVKRVDVVSAHDMAEAVGSIEADVAVMTAAVADFRPKTAQASKLARGDGLRMLELEATRDVLGEVLARERRPRVVVGFAAETGGVERAVRKAKSKGVDLMVANDVTIPGSGFESDNNQVALIRRGGETESWPLQPKVRVAERLWDEIALMLEEN
ncbi:MAG: bifunctional phosphopantothenoylcysteine decarboxylase/phosphopantothenate--cysteine ligase CoaBC [bacterium]|nr:bifunctional phosphopantothenoylcysteine decarboxylase/phosphopantothenate--cysteine ligase CoaBC [bacterium]MDE0502009.1 bifunctional phosphopantothenoylcysteine decarboxylase/phosphopantothenate--cysteine ligase CoaBC [bacterium]